MSSALTLLFGLSEAPGTTPGPRWRWCWRWYSAARRWARRSGDSHRWWPILGEVAPGSLCALWVGTLLHQRRWTPRVSSNLLYPKAFVYLTNSWGLTFWTGGGESLASPKSMEVHRKPLWSNRKMNKADTMGAKVSDWFNDVQNTRFSGCLSFCFSIWMQWLVLQLKNMCQSTSSLPWRKLIATYKA